MKLKLENVRLAFIHFWEQDKYDNFSGQFRFDDVKHKEAIEAAIAKEAATAFGAKTASILKNLTAGNKLFKVHDGADKEHDEAFFISAKNKARFEVRGPRAEVVGASDNVFYSGCRVDIWLDVSAFIHSKGDGVVSVKLMGVQFRGHDTPLTAAPKMEASDFTVIAEDDL
jgi:hypothetical protein